jgi:hypothetical protein
VAGSIQKTVDCSGCGLQFVYRLERSARGTGSSHYFADNKVGRDRAVASARANLESELRRGVDPVPCPHCGIYQPEMDRLLRKRHGRKYDPNAYAAQRVQVPQERAWMTALISDTVEAYSAFLRVWPTSKQRPSAQKRMYELEGRTLKLAWLAWFRRSPKARGTIMARMAWITILAALLFIWLSRSFFG